MRKLLLFVFIFFLVCNTLSAQVYHPPLGGTYARYHHTEGGGYVRQTLKLTGANYGRYTLDDTVAGEPKFSSGEWKKAKLWRPHTDSLQVVALDYENEHDARYLEIERTGCLTPVDEDGYRQKKANSFAPARK